MRNRWLALIALATILGTSIPNPSTAKGDRALAAPAPQPAPLCLASLDRQLATLSRILDDYATNGWSQRVQDALDALVGPGFSLSQRSNEAYALESLTLDGNWQAIQDELDRQLAMSPGQRDTYQARRVDEYACSLFGRGPATRAGIPMRTSLLAVIAATAATLQDPEVDDTADDDLFGDDWPSFEWPPDPPGWRFEPGVPFDACLTASHPISDGLEFTAFICDFNDGGAEPDIGVGIGLRWSW